MNGLEEVPVDANIATKSSGYNTLFDQEEIAQEKRKDTDNEDGPKKKFKVADKNDKTSDSGVDVDYGILDVVDSCPSKSRQRVGCTSDDSDIELIEEIDLSDDSTYSVLSKSQTVSVKNCYVRLKNVHFNKTCKKCGQYLHNVDQYTHRMDGVSELSIVKNEHISGFRWESCIEIGTKFYL